METGYGSAEWGYHTNLEALPNQLVQLMPLHPITLHKTPQLLTEYQELSTNFHSLLFIFPQYFTSHSNPQINTYLPTVVSTNSGV